MKAIKGVLWPPEMMEYVEGVSSGVVRASGSYDSANGYIVAKQNDLQYCIPKPVTSYIVLRQIISRLAALNGSFELYFRGQPGDYGKNGEENSAGHSLLPSIWRGNPEESELKDRFDLLEDRQRQLISEYERYTKKETRTSDLLKKTPLAAWALLQHYEVCPTPLLDITRTLQIACSFALMDGSEGFIYVVGLPFQSEKIMTVTDEGVLAMSLLGITPSNASRPLVQDGYLLCDRDWWKWGKPDSCVQPRGPLDPSRRLMAVFRIGDDNGAFWKGSGLCRLSLNDLCPQDDAFLVDVIAKFK